jgi:hypothetical protein
MTLDPISIAALGAACVILLMLLFVRARQRSGRRRPSRQEALDTVIGWQPEAARVLTSGEMQALDTLQRAMPGFLVLSQVPLSRFLRVPTRNSYSDWLSRVGNLNADLLLCDTNSRVLAVIDVRAPQESDRSKRRHERMQRVLRAAGIPVHVWRQDRLPGLADVRAQLDILLSTNRQRPAGAPAAWSSTSRPAPLAAVPDLREVLAEGDALAEVVELPEPVASAFFEELELANAGAAR